MNATSTVATEQDVVRPAPGTQFGAIATAVPPGIVRRLSALPQEVKAFMSVDWDCPQFPVSDAKRNRPGPVGSMKFVPPKSSCRLPVPVTCMTLKSDASNCPAVAFPGWLPVTEMAPIVNPPTDPEKTMLNEFATVTNPAPQ